jgi:hypothetical protein
MGLCDLGLTGAISSNLLSLGLYMSGSSSALSVYSILSTLRICYTIRYLQITLEHKQLVENDNIK